AKAAGEKDLTRPRPDLRAAPDGTGENGCRAAPEFPRPAAAPERCPISLRHCGERQAGAKSAAASVCGKGRGVGSGTVFRAPAFAGVPVSWEPMCSLKYS